MLLLGGAWSGRGQAQQTRVGVVHYQAFNVCCCRLVGGWGEDESVRLEMGQALKMRCCWMVGGWVGQNQRSTCDCKWYAASPLTLHHLLLAEA